MTAVRVIFSILLLAVLPSWSGATRWQSYTEADGVPGGTAADIVQAPDGSMWVASSGGIARIDRRKVPVRWESISTQPFRVLAVDSHGIIWAAGAQGSVQWFQQDGTALATPVVVAAEDIVALDAGPDGEMWIGQSNWLRRWHADLPGGVAEGWMLPGSAIDTRIFDLQHTPLGNVWLGLARGMAYFEAGSFTTVFLPGSGFGADQIASAVHVLDNEDVIVGTGSGKAYIYSRSTVSFSQEIFADGGSGQKPLIEDIERDALGRLWFARKEAIRFDTRGDLANPGIWSRTILGADAGLNGDILKRIVESSPFVGTAGAAIGSREMWFANDLGVSVQSGLPWTNYRTETGGLTGGDCVVSGDCNIVQNIAVDRVRDEVWFGARWGLSRLRAGSQWDVWTNGLFGTPPGLVGNTVDALYVDDAGRAWVASSAAGSVPAGLQYHEAGAANDVWVTLGTDTDRWRVADMTGGAAGIVWCAALDGVWRLDTSTMPFGETHFGVADGAPAGPMQAVAVGEGFVFAASAAGVGRFDATSGWVSWSLDALPTPRPTVFNDLHVQDGRLYAGTDAGMLVLPVQATSLAEAQVLSAATAPEGGFANNIRDIADGGNGSVLVATLSGLYRVNSTLDQTGRIGVREGLPEEQLLCIASDGDEVWIGTAGDGAAAHRFEAPETALLQPPADVVTASVTPVVIVVAGADSDSPQESLRFQLRINNGPWQAAVSGPNLSFVPAAFGLQEGMHVLQVRAVDSGLIADGTPATAAFDLDTTPPNPQVTSPTEGAAVRGVVAVTGTTEDLEDGRFESYTVRVRLRDDNSAPPALIKPVTSIAVIDSTIASWDTTTFPDDWYVLEVLVIDAAGVQGVQRVRVLVDNVAPFVDVTSPVRVLGTQGATVFAAAGDASFMLPAFAFEGEQQISLERRLESGAIGGFAYDVGPGNLAIRKLGTLEIAVPAGTTDELAIHRFQDGNWTALGGTRENRVTGTFYAVGIDQLGSYSLRPLSTQPSGGNIISQMETEPRHFKPRSGTADRISVSFVLSQPMPVKAMVYNRAGRPRRVLVDGAQLGSGQQVLYWDGRDQDGSVVASALYIIVVEAGGERVTKVVTVGHD